MISRLSLLSVILLATSLQKVHAQARLSAKFIDSKAVNDFFFYQNEALKGKDVSNSSFGQFLSGARSASDLKRYLDDYFAEFNQKAADEIKAKGLKVNLADSMDGYSKAVALHKIYQHAKNSKSTKYNGNVEVNLYQSSSNVDHLKLISSDAPTKLGYDKAVVMGQADLLIKAPEGFEDWEIDHSNDKGPKKVVFTMSEGDPVTIELPADKNFFRVTSRSVSRRSSEGGSSDGDYYVRRSTSVSDRRLVGFLIQDADVQSDPSKRYMIVTRNNEHSYRTELGDLEGAKEIFVDSADTVISLQNTLSQLKKDGKISMNPQVQDLFNLDLPGSSTKCTEV